MAKAIAAHFADELRAAGLLGRPFTWGEDGAFHFDPAMLPAERDAVLAVYAAHDPADAAKAAAYVEARRLEDFDEARLLKAVAVWTAQKLGIPLATARAEIVAIARTL
jgi:hypothetical protein